MDCDGGGERGIFGGQHWLTWKWRELNEMPNVIYWKTETQRAETKKVMLGVRASPVGSV